VTVQDDLDLLAEYLVPAPADMTKEVTMEHEGTRALARVREHIEQLREECEIHERLAEAAEAFVWDSRPETDAALREARGRWQTEIGMHRLRARHAALASSQDGEQR
jgi:hypothetical protein